jgi:hypothetical protein
MKKYIMMMLLAIMLVGACADAPERHELKNGNIGISMNVDDAYGF